MEIVGRRHFVTFFLFVEEDWKKQQQETRDVGGSSQEITRKSSNSFE
jgi:hypothetical protein